LQNLYVRDSIKVRGCESSSAGFYQQTTCLRAEQRNDEDADAPVRIMPSLDAGQVIFWEGMEGPRDRHNEKDKCKDLQNGA